jgi:gamma-glutamyltranspeptidase/glutathione hydrolase
MNLDKASTIFRDASTRLGTHDVVGEDGSRAAYRPIARGLFGAVASGHMLSAMAGHDVLRRGGNAIDAGVAAGLCLCVVEHDRTSIGGVAPIMVFEAATGTLKTIDGLGGWPKAATLEYFERTHGGKFAPGMSTSVIPLAMDGWLLTLKRFGTWSFENAVQQSVVYAEDGFPVSEVMQADIIEYLDGFAGWPTNVEIFTPGGRVPEIGDVLKQPALARTFRRLIEVERAAKHLGREAAIDAVRDFFYRGEIGQKLVAFSQENDGLLSMEDMEAAVAKEEDVARYTFGGYEVCTCGPWTQGPALLQVLALLESYDLKAMGHNSPEYIHTITEAVKVAFADRDAYYGDPNFVHVPLDELMAPDYVAERRALINAEEAWPTMPPFGVVSGAKAYFGRTPPHEDKPLTGKSTGPDTTVLSVIDRHGNMFCASPSDPALRHMIDPDLGFGISHRGTQSWLHPNHPSVLAPGKRPRLTTNPVLVLKDGKPFMALCTPGGDVQPQAMLQVFLNMTVFGMNAQQATEMPRFVSFSFPATFYPHGMQPGQLAIEDRIDAATIEELRRKGHKIKKWPGWTGNSGGVCVIVRNEETHVLDAGADPRRDAYAVAS